MYYQLHIHTQDHFVIEIFKLKIIVIFFFSSQNPLSSNITFFSLNTLNIYFINDYKFKQLTYSYKIEQVTYGSIIFLFAALHLRISHQLVHTN